MAESCHIVCPQCAAINRLPIARLQSAPRCGTCHAPLFSGQPLNLGDQNFQRHIERDDIPVLVDFWAEWCGPCKMMAPAYQQAAVKLEPRVRVAKVNTETAPGIAGRYDIRSIPTLILFRGGQELGRQAGAMGAGDIVRWVESQLWVTSSVLKVGTEIKINRIVQGDHNIDCRVDKVGEMMLKSDFVKKINV